MSDLDIVEVDFRRALSLVVVAGLEVALGCIKIIGVQLLEVLSVDADGQHVVLVSDLVCESLAGGDVVDIGPLLRAGSAGLDSHFELSILSVVELRDGLGRDGVVDVNLTDADGTSVLSHNKVGREAVDGVVGAPFRWVVLAKLGAAVITVRRGDTVRVRRVAGDFHDQGTVTVVGIEVVVFVTITARQLVTGDRVGASIGAAGELQLPLGEVKVASRSAARVLSVGRGNEEERHEGEPGLGNRCNSHCGRL